MNFRSNVTPVELDAFIKAADQYLQMLDDMTLKLDVDKTDISVIRELAQLTNRLGEASSSISYAPMAELSGTIESFLIKIINNHLQIDTGTIDHLLKGIDVLKDLKQKLLADNGLVPDINLLKSEFENLFHSIESVQRPSANNLERSSPGIFVAYPGGDAIYLVTIKFNSSSRLPAAQCYQVFSALSELGQVIWSLPAMQDIKVEPVGHELRVLMSTRLPAHSIRTACESVKEVLAVDLSDIKILQANQARMHERHPGSGQFGHVDVPALADSEMGPGAELSSSSKPAGNKLATQASAYSRAFDSLLNQASELFIEQAHAINVQRIISSHSQADENTSDLLRISIKVLKELGDLQITLLEARNYTNAGSLTDLADHAGISTP
jgi:two-component system chemotaxis sensor kinase CheA